MKKCQFHPEPALPEDDHVLTAPAKAKRTVEKSRRGDGLDVCRCPKCTGPMTIRYGKNGPYFHCRCFETKGDRSQEVIGTKIPEAGEASKKLQPEPGALHSDATALVGVIAMTQLLTLQPLPLPSPLRGERGVAL